MDHLHLHLCHLPLPVALGYAVQDLHWKTWRLSSLSGDYQLEDTLYLPFTTRQFSDGVPTILTGTPVITGYRDANLTQFTTGITLSANFDSIAGLNMITVVATAANSYAAGESYTLYISAGTVGGVSVVGEVVANFTLDMSAAAKDLANGTDGLGAIKAETALIVADTGELQADDVPNLISTLDAVVDTVKAETVLILADTDELQQDWTNTGRLDTIIDSILADTGELQADDVPTLISTLDAVVDTVKAETALIVLDTNELQTDDVPGLISTLDAVVDTVKAETVLIVADTDILQSEWANGGRLDNLLDGASAPSAATVADAVWDETLAGHVTADTSGLLLNEWQDGGRLDLILDARMAEASIDTTGGAVDNVTLVATTTTNTDMVAAAPTVAAVVDGVWDETMAGHTTADTSGLVMNEWQDGGRLDLIVDAIVADTGELQADDVPGLISTLDAVVDTVKVDTAAILLDTDVIDDGTSGLVKIATDVAAILVDSTSLNDTKIPDTISLAAINAEVDTALDTTIAELGVAQPTATPTIRTGIMLMYMALRNKLDVQTSGTDSIELHNAAGTEITQKLITDDGSDYSEAAMS